jgi:L-cystine uptake protein TcyP (sodium:dicarboxylate symporter family)
MPENVVVLIVLLLVVFHLAERERRFGLRILRRLILGVPGR